MWFDFITVLKIQMNKSEILKRITLKTKTAVIILKTIFAQRFLSLFQTRIRMQP